MNRATRRNNRRRLNGNARGPKLVRPLFLGVDTTAWSDLPPAQYPPEVVDLIGRLLEAGDRLARIDVYRCDACQLDAVIRLTHPGVAPTVVDHRKLDPATRCPGLTRSQGWPEDAAHLAPAFEFYRPAERELLDLEDELIDYVLRGGLLLRPIAPEARA